MASSSSASSQNVVLTLDSANWYGKSGVSVAQQSGGANVNYLADWNAAGFWVAPANAGIEGYTIEIDVQVSTEFKTSGAALYIYAFIDANPYPSESDCSWLMNSALVAGTPQTIQCTISTGGVFSQTTSPVEIQLVARTDTGVPNGTVLITGGRVIAP